MTIAYARLGGGGKGAWPTRLPIALHPITVSVRGEANHRRARIRAYTRSNSAIFCSITDAEGSTASSSTG